MLKYKKHPKFDNIYFNRHPKQFLTINMDINRSVYGERLREQGDLQLREWDPHRSKLCAALHENARDSVIRANSNVLYLGASSGTTVSHVSDITYQGIVYAVEFSQRSVRELVQNCTDRPNVVPILADANHPYEYSTFIQGEIDIIYQDVAQPNQTEIIVKNAKYFLKDGGQIIYCIKARSIDTVEDPDIVFAEQADTLEKSGFKIDDNVNITKYQTDHRVIFATYHQS